MGERHHTASDGGARSTAASRWGSFQIPWVVCWPTTERLCRGHTAKFGQVGFTDRDETGLAEASAKFGVAGANMAHVLEGSVSGPVGEACLIRSEVLEQKRYAGERATWEIGRLSSFSGTLIVLIDDGVYIGVQRLNTIDGRINQLKRRRVAVRHEFGLRRGVQLRQFVHRGNLVAPSCRRDIAGTHQARGLRAEPS